MNKIMPHNIEAEQSVLGAILLDNYIMNSILDNLLEEDFFDLRNKVIYKAMKELHNNQSAIDYTTLISELNNKDELKQAGGIDYLGIILDYLPSTTNVSYYINLVKDASLKRKIIQITKEISEEGFDGELSSTEYLDRAESKIFELSKRRKTGEFISMPDITKEVIEKIEQNISRKSDVTGLVTGLYDLDKATSGLKGEELIILAARPSMGKSALAINIAVNCAKMNKEGKAVIGIFSLEMSNDQIVERIFASEALIDSNKIKSGKYLTTDEWNLILAARNNLNNLDIYFSDTSSITVSDIRAKSRKLSHEKGLDLIVIDYLQLIKGEARHGGNRQEEVSNISRSLKQLARELKIPIIALSQLSREVEKREDKKPIMADLRESGSIEQDADIVLFLYREDYYKREMTKDNKASLIIAKNRQGVSGIELTMMFEPQFSLFKNMASNE